MYMAKCRTVTAEVFAKVPESLRKKGMQSSRTVGFRGRPTQDHSFLEGPAFDPSGNLYVVDVPFGRIFKIDSQGNMDVALEYSGEPSGMKFVANGRALVADQVRGLMELDFVQRTAEPVLTRRYVEGFRGLNDLCIARSGEVYFTETGFSDMRDPTGRVHCRLPNGMLRLLVTNGVSPNGIVLSPDENMLYVSMTRANSVWRCPLMEDGTTVKAGAFVNLSGGNGPDGMAMDESGGLVVAHYQLGVVWIFDPNGEPSLRIESPVGKGTTNVAFGGSDRRTLYITEAESGSVLVARVDVPGVKLI